MRMGENKTPREQALENIKRIDGNDIERLDKHPG
jgi:hypothetical protein